MLTPPLPVSPRLSVCIVTFNRARRLQENLDHLLAEDVPGREIVVVDGGSRDETVELLRSYGERVRWISERDRGEYDGWNKAFAFAKGEIIKALPDDDSLRHGACQVALDYFAQHPEVELLWGQAQIWQENEAGQRTQQQTPVVLDPQKLQKQSLLRQQHGLNSVAIFMRKSMLERLGPMRIDLSCGDTEYWVRAADAGVQMAIVPDVFVDYVMTGDNGVITRNWKLSRDVLRINLKYGTPADIAWTLWNRRDSLAGVPTIQHEIGKVAQRIGFHPYRWGRALRQRVQETLKR